MATILVVDDRPTNRQFLLTLLGYGGHRMLEAADGAEALKVVRTERPDLVITDLLMPNMDGEEFTRQVRADPATRELPVIFYTATYRQREAREIADRVGVRIVLAKPCEPKVIIASVDEALGAVAAAAPPRRGDGSGTPQPEVAAPGRGVVGQIDSVQDLNLRLAHLLQSAIRIAEEQAKSLTAVRELEDALQNVQSLGLRLTSLVELGLDLSKTRDPAELTELFCRATQDILSSHYAGVVVLAGDGVLDRFAARGLDDATRERVAGEIAGCPAAQRVLGPGAGRLVIGAKAGDVTGLPASHPGVKSFLACPISAHGTAHGWMYVADRLGGGAFTTDDERIAMALGAQFAIAWDSLALYGKLEGLVAQRTRQLEASNRELEAFSYSVSHDLRAPLRAIDGFTRMVLDDHAGKLPAEGQRQLGKVRAQTQKMGSLIDDLLELARVGRRELGLHPVKLGELVRNCWSELRAEQEGRQVELAVGELPAWNGDRILLKQLFLNLLSNALKYTRKRDAARVEVGAERRGAEQVVFVRDNGAGFDMAHAEKLFGVFQRLHAQEEYPGTGVGLAIVRRVAERHGGRVWAEAAPGRGATFFVAFPASAAP